MKYKSVVFALAALLCSAAMHAQHTLSIKVNEPKAVIEPGMWGVFFEDINFGADGGIYAEMVKNRSFEFNKPLMGWKILGKPATEGDFLVLNRMQANTANPRYLRVTLHNNAKGSIGLNNEGFRSMGIKNGLRYDFSVLYRQTTTSNKMHIELVSDAGGVIGGATITTGFTGAEWKKESVSFTANATVLKGSMNIWFEGDGSIDLDMVSLFPGDTWKNRPGGMRADMVQALADMKPGFIRFPGGCIVEGSNLEQRYQWKNTIGPVEERQLIINRWNFEYARKLAPDYFQTFGLGFFEYFQLAEDIGAKPLPILNCGMACQFNSAEAVPVSDLDPYVQDALDLIEFANGDASTKWGKVRAGMGHPASFNLTMMGIGNENWGPQYVERLQIFTKAIKAKYPAFKLVNSSGTDPNGARFEYLDKQLRAMKADIIDEHYYRKPDWFFSNAKRYDNYPRNGVKIFCGEYAAHIEKDVKGELKNCWLSALSEAAFMTGLERNADVVSIASYAPLFAHIDAWQWTPDLIWVNNLHLYGTPDYYIQQLFSLNQGTRVLPITLNNEVVAGGTDSLYATASLNENSKELIVKIVNASGKEQNNSLSLEGAKKLAAQGLLTVMQSNDLYSVNSFDQPQNIAPKESTVAIKGKKINLVTAPYSFSVLRVKVL